MGRPGVAHDSVRTVAGQIVDVAVGGRTVIVFQFDLPKPRRPLRRSRSRKQFQQVPFQEGPFRV